ncbi:MAG: TAXI family TRAP transporter solute-binding subunit [Pikeienuella sp.]
MIDFRIPRRGALAALAALAAAAVFPAHAQTTNLRVHTTNPGSSAFTFTTTMQKIAQRELPVKMNVTSGMTSTRSTLDAARGQVDFFISSPAINYFMANKTAMYSEMENAPELFKNVRAVVNFPLGPYHIITYADSGIASLEDIKGKRVFLGPPGGAATRVALLILESATGYKPDQDYELSKLDWSSGNQAFQDRQVDLAIIPTELPSASIQQFALLGEIRLIGISEEAFSRGPLEQWLTQGVPGRVVVEIPPDIYGDNQVNEEPIKALGSWVGIGTQVKEDEEIVYQLTKAIFENIGEFHETADWMKAITLETAIMNMYAPLHPGALRYYREAGLEIPENLIPPEAK